MLTFLLANWRTVFVLAAFACLGAYGLLMRSERDHARSEYATFKAQVATAAEVAAELALKKTVQDEQRKEAADADHEKTVAALNARIASLRARHPVGSAVPPAPAGSSHPELSCFDRGAFERAYGELVTEIRAGADEGTAATIDLNTAKDWVKTR